MLSVRRVVVRSLVHYWRIHLLVALGVAIATTVWTGALLVGDSVRYSLRALALDNLQQIDFALVGDRFFRLQLADELRTNPAFQEDFDAAVGIVYLPQVTVETFNDTPVSRSSGVALLGTGAEFWDLGRGVRPQRLPGRDEIVLNDALATELGVQVNDQVLVRLPSSDQVPADSPLGRKSDRVRSVTGLRVIEILPAEGLGQFRLRTSQQTARNAYVSMETLQRAVEVPDKVNALLVSSKSQEIATDPHSAERLAQLLHPTLEDRGITIERVTVRFPADADQDASGIAVPAPESDTTTPRTIIDQYQLTSDRLIWDDATAQVVRNALADRALEEIFTYLINTIEPVESTESDVPRQIPYSMVSAVGPNAWARLAAAEESAPTSLDEGDIVINQWAAEDMQVTVGDKLRLTYFEPETTHGRTQEAAAEFTIAAILPLTEPLTPYRRRRPAVFDVPPTPANDPGLTPTVEGVTDEESIANWDPPFPYDSSRVRDEDDAYWQNHRTTPKAFVALSAGRQMWGSRFGQVTSFRVPASQVESQAQLAQRLSQALADNPATAFQFLEVKQQALQAAAGTTPFEGLFLGFSMFLIASALMLVALLFRLGTETRAREAGLLRAVGWDLSRVRRLWLYEGGLVATAGALVGALGGIGYASLMLAGLRTWWVAAIVTPFLQLHVNGLVLGIGAICGIIVGLGVIAVSVRRLRKSTPRDLLGGQLEDTQVSYRPVRGRWSQGIAVVLVVLAVILSVVAMTLRGEAQAGAFFGAGACVLAAGIVYVVRRLKYAGYAARSARVLSLTGLAARAASRNPTRSALTVGLMATACFLIVAISAFRLSPTEEGTGGYNLIATTDRPLFVDLQQVLHEELRSGEHGAAAGGNVLVLPMRVHEGDDASCRNLYRPARPRVLGVDRQIVENQQLAGMQFRWAESAAQTAEERANPWRLLFESDGNSGPDDAVPVVLDKNTAMYSLRLYEGVGQEFVVEFSETQHVRFRVVGLLANSVLQGSLLIADFRLTQLFPGNEGSRYFLVHTGQQHEQPVQEFLETQYGDQGMDVERSVAVLREFLAVQNTYLSTFQSLGGLGILLGTLGLAVVQTRSVMERRGELALLRSVGFPQRRIGTLVLLENVWLLVVGLGVGIVAALIAVAPHMVPGGASVPWNTLAWILALILVVGMASALLTVRRAVKAPIVAALRGD